MPQPGRSRKGSMGFNPRKRVVKEVPRIKSWPSDDGSPALQGFAGYKAGVTHVIMVNDKTGSPHEGMEGSVPVTVIETPPVRAVALHAYKQTPYGMKSQTEVWAGEFHDELDRILNLSTEDTFGSGADALRETVETSEIDDPRIITHTMPSELTSMPKRKPDVMETHVDDGSMVEHADFALGLVTEDGEHKMSDVFHAGEYLNTAGVTKGGGMQGPIKRWGVQERKDRRARRDWRHRTGNLDP